MVMAFMGAVLGSRMAPVRAGEVAVPGKSLWGFTLGTTRTKALAAVKKQWPKAKRETQKTYKDGVTEDAWYMPGHKEFGADDLRFAILSKGGKVIQIRANTSEDNGLIKLDFAQLLKRYKLQKSVHGFDDYVGFYYDDVKRGICYTKGMQDLFLLTYEPDGVIIHKPGVPVLPREYGFIGEKMTGDSARAFANEAEMRRFEEQERKKQ